MVVEAGTDHTAPDYGGIEGRGGCVFPELTSQIHERFSVYRMPAR
jgi:hypothetical protein